MTYYIRQIKNRIFQLEYNGEMVSELKFPSWKNYNGVITSNEGTINFTKKSFWKSTYLFSKNEQPIGKISSNWKGHFFVHLFEQPDLVPSNMEMEEEVEELNSIAYRIKTKGVFKHRYELYQDNDTRPLITLHSETNWFKVNYRVELHRDDLFSFDLTDMLGIMNFCAFLIRMRQAAMAGGA